MRVLGVDSSLTSTGLATVWASNSTLLVDIEASTTTARKGDRHAEKHARMHTQVDRVTTAAAGASVVLLEGLSFASKGAATRDLAGLWWLILDALRGRVPLGIVPPGVLKKWVTGSGNADKFRVGQAIAKRWPDVDLRSNDEADALGLASMGLHHGGRLPWKPTAYQTEQIGRVEWLEAR